MAIIEGFKKDYSGLTNYEVEETLSMFGKNIFYNNKKSTSLGNFIKEITQPFDLVIAILTLISFFNGHFAIGTVLLVFTAIHISLNILLQKRFDDEAESLKKHSFLKVNAIRSGKEIILTTDELLPGDIIVIHAGEKVPADGEILEEHDLSVDESLFTGDHVVTYKSAAPDNSENQLKKNYVYSGTTVLSGEAIVKVFAIGKRSLCIRTDKVRMHKPLRPTNSEKKALMLSSRLGVFSVIPLIITFFSLYTLQSYSTFFDCAMYSAAIAISLVPCCLPLVISALIYFDITKIKKHGVHFVNYKASDKLKDISVLCVDKTGIITSNNLSIAEIYSKNKQLFAHISTLACDRSVYNPIDDAILTFCTKVGTDVPVLQSNYLIHTFPFEPDIKMCGYVWKIGNNALLCAKGSPEGIINICNISEAEKTEITEKYADFAKKGYSVIAVACKELDKSKELVTSLEYENGLTFTGLFAIKDPPRESVTEAVSACNENGLRVIMVTGDNPDTASTVAANIGLDVKNEIITGEIISNCSDDDLIEIVNKTSVFARISPDDKVRIIKALQRCGNHVAISGENDSDVEALKKADIGICVGKNASDFAKEASDIILDDNSFEKISSVLGLGRNLFSKLIKSAGFTLSFQISLFLLNFFTIAFFGGQPLFLPIDIGLISLIVFSFGLFVFKNINNDFCIPKHKITISVVSYNIIFYIIYTAIMTITCLVSYKLAMDSMNIYYARAFSLSVFILSIIFSSFVIMSNERFGIISFIQNIKNREVVFTVLIAVIVLPLIIFVSPLNIIFGLADTQTLTFWAFVLTIIIAFIPATAMDIIKTFKRY